MSTPTRLTEHGNKGDPDYAANFHPGWAPKIVEELRRGLERCTHEPKHTNAWKCSNYVYTRDTEPPRFDRPILTLDKRDWPRPDWDPVFSDVGHWQEGRLPTDFLRSIALKYEAHLQTQREYAHGDRWENFKADIAINGVKEAVLVMVNDPRDLRRPPIQIEGQRRILASFELGLPTVPVVVRYFGMAGRPGGPDLFADVHVRLTEHGDKSDPDYYTRYHPELAPAAQHEDATTRIAALQPGAKSVISDPRPFPALEPAQREQVQIEAHRLAEMGFRYPVEETVVFAPPIDSDPSRVTNGIFSPLRGRISINVNPQFTGYASVSDLGDVFRHEYGHALWTIIPGPQRAQIESAMLGWMRQQTPEAIKATVSNYAYDDFVEGESDDFKIAGADYHEVWAETFAILTRPDYKMGTLPYDAEVWDAMTAANIQTQEHGDPEKDADYYTAFHPKGKSRLILTAPDAQWKKASDFGSLASFSHEEQSHVEVSAKHLESLGFTEPAYVVTLTRDPGESTLGQALPFSYYRDGPIEQAGPGYIELLPGGNHNNDWSYGSHIGDTFRHEYAHQLLMGLGQPRRNEVTEWLNDHPFWGEVDAKGYDKMPELLSSYAAERRGEEAVAEAFAFVTSPDYVYGTVPYDLELLGWMGATRLREHGSKDDPNYYKYHPDSAAPAGSSKAAGEALREMYRANGGIEVGGGAGSTVIRFEDDGTPYLATLDDNKFGWPKPDMSTKRPPEYLWRAITEESWQRTLKDGFYKSQGRMNLFEDEGTVASFDRIPLFYLPGNLASNPPGDYPARIIRIDYRPEDGWKGGKGDSYGKTQSPIPLDRITWVSPPIVTRRYEGPNTALFLLDEELAEHGDKGRADYWKYHPDTTDYRIQHTAPAPTYGAPLHDLTAGDLIPPDIYDRTMQRRLYGYPYEAARHGPVFDVLNRVRGQPNAKVTIYRGVRSKNITRINPGDWVTLSRPSAEWYTIGDNDEVVGHVLSLEVPASEVWWNGDSIEEWGWWPEGFVREHGDKSDPNYAAEFHPGTGTEQAKMYAGWDAEKRADIQRWINTGLFRQGIILNRTPEEHRQLVLEEAERLHEMGFQNVVWDITDDPAAFDKVRVGEFAPGDRQIRLDWQQPMGSGYSTAYDLGEAFRHEYGHLLAFEMGDSAHDQVWALMTDWAGTGDHLAEQVSQYAADSWAKGNTLELHAELFNVITHPGYTWGTIPFDREFLRLHLEDPELLELAANERRENEDWARRYNAAQHREHGDKSSPDYERDYHPGWGVAPEGATASQIANPTWTRDMQQWWSTGIIKEGEPFKNLTDEERAAVQAEAQRLHEMGFTEQVRRTSDDFDDPKTRGYYRPAYGEMGLRSEGVYDRYTSSRDIRDDFRHEYGHALWPGIGWAARPPTVPLGVPITPEQGEELRAGAMYAIGLQQRIMGAIREWGEKVGHTGRVATISRYFEDGYLGEVEHGDWEAWAEVFSVMTRPDYRAGTLPFDDVVWATLVEGGVMAQQQMPLLREHGDPQRDDDYYTAFHPPSDPVERGLARVALARGDNRWGSSQTAEESERGINEFINATYAKAGVTPGTEPNSADLLPYLPPTYDDVPGLTPDPPDPQALVVYRGPDGKRAGYLLYKPIPVSPTRYWVGGTGWVDAPAGYTWTGQITSLEILDSQRGKGLAKAMYDWVQANTDLDLIGTMGYPMDEMTPAGKGFAQAWLRHRLKMREHGDPDIDEDYYTKFHPRNGGAILPPGAITSTKQRTGEEEFSEQARGWIEAAAADLEHQGYTLPLRAVKPMPDWEKDEFLGQFYRGGSPPEWAPGTVTLLVGDRKRALRDAEELAFTFRHEYGHALMDNMDRDTRRALAKQMRAWAYKYGGSTPQERRRWVTGHITWYAAKDLFSGRSKYQGTERGEEALADVFAIITTLKGRKKSALPFEEDVRAAFEAVGGAPVAEHGDPDTTPPAEYAQMHPNGKRLVVPEVGPRTGYPEPYDPNVPSPSGEPVSKADYLYWTAATNERMESIKTHGMEHGAIGQRLTRAAYSSPPTTQMLYRGARSAKPWEFYVGQRLHWGITSFSADFNVAWPYAGRMGTLRKVPLYGAIIRLEPGARAFHISALGGPYADDEWVAAFGFEVVKVGREALPDGSEVPSITIRQVGDFRAREHGDPVRDPDYEMNYHPGPVGPDMAIERLAAGQKANVHPTQVAGVLKRAASSKTPLDLTRLHVSGAPVFGGGMGIPRSQMPSLPMAARDTFIEHLQGKGVSVWHEAIRPAVLRPIQGEMDAVKVGQMFEGLLTGTLAAGEVVATRDGFVLDGHHRWATGRARAFVSPDLTIPVLRIDMDAHQLLGLARTWTEVSGIPVRKFGEAETVSRHDNHHPTVRCPRCVDEFFEHGDPGVTPPDKYQQMHPGSSKPYMGSARKRINSWSNYPASLPEPEYTEQDDADFYAEVAAAKVKVDGPPGETVVKMQGAQPTGVISYDGDGRVVAAVGFTYSYAGQRMPDGISLVIVRPSARRQGYGFRLYDYIQDHTDVNLYDVIGGTLTARGKVFALGWLNHRLAIERARDPEFVETDAKTGLGAAIERVRDAPVSDDGTEVDPEGEDAMREHGDPDTMSQAEYRAKYHPGTGPSHHGEYGKTWGDARGAKWRKANQKRYDEDPEFARTVDAVTAFTHGEYRSMRNSRTSYEELLEQQGGGSSFQDKEDFEKWRRELSRHEVKGYYKGSVARVGMKGQFDLRHDYGDEYTAIFTNPQTYGEAQDRLRALLQSAPPMEDEVYRGISIWRDGKWVPPAVGDVFDMVEPTSFTRNEDFALRWASGEASGQNYSGKPYASVVLYLRGLNGVDVSALSSFRQQEVLGVGKYRVADVKRYGGRSVWSDRPAEGAMYHVTLESVA